MCNRCMYFSFAVSNDETSKANALIVTSTRTIDMEILNMYFEHFSEKFEICKSGKSQWIVKFADWSGKAIRMYNYCL